MYYVYRYVRKSDSKTVYVGRTHYLKERFLMHLKEPRFLEDDYDVLFIEVKNEAEADSLETHFMSVFESGERYGGYNKTKSEWGQLSFAPEFEWKNIDLLFDGKSEALSQLEHINATIAKRKSVLSSLDLRIKEKEKKLKKLDAAIEGR